MTVKITILGLGQIGASIGLALGEHKELVHRSGFDRNLLAAREAHKLGAVDALVNTFRDAANADILLLCLPASEIKETLEALAPHLKEGTVVMDTAPLKGATAGWVKELLPAGCHYVGLVPVINPAYLLEDGTGLEAAHADLFHKGMLLIAAPPETGGDAIRLAGDLARLIGAEALYADLIEADGLAAAAHTLPQLAAAALVHATTRQPGWRDGRKIAGRPYAEGTRAREAAAALAAEAALNSENVARVLDDYIAALRDLRAHVLTRNEGALREHLEAAATAREKWLREREAADWMVADRKGPDIPTVRETFQQMFLGGLFRKKKP